MDMVLFPLFYLQTVSIIWLAHGYILADLTNQFPFDLYLSQSRSGIVFTGQWSSSYLQVDNTLLALNT